MQILSGLLAPATLRHGITQTEAIETFRQLQDFINARNQAEDGAQSFEERERRCRTALNIFLYGVVEKGSE